MAGTQATFSVAKVSPLNFVGQNGFFSTDFEPTPPSRPRPPGQGPPGAAPTEGQDTQPKKPHPPAPGPPPTPRPRTNKGPRQRAPAKRARRGKAFQVWKGPVQGQRAPAKRAMKKVFFLFRNRWFCAPLHFTPEASQPPKGFKSFKRPPKRRGTTRFVRAHNETCDFLILKTMVLGTPARNETCSFLVRFWGTLHFTPKRTRKAPGSPLTHPKP